MLRSLVLTCHVGIFSNNNKFMGSLFFSLKQLELANWLLILCTALLIAGFNGEPSARDTPQVPGNKGLEGFFLSSNSSKEKM